ncbi:HU family DNA-binding protein [Parabacteroides sp.]
MSVKYKLVQRPDFSKGAAEGAKKYFAQMLSNGTVSFDELCESIAEETALTSADVKSCFDRLPRILSRHLKEGRNVQLGELGSMRLATGSKGSATEKEFDAAVMMKKPSLVYTPGKILQDMRTKVTYERIKSATAPNSGSGDSESPDEI